jgi:hypothetical protein
LVCDFYLIKKLLNCNTKINKHSHILNNLIMLKKILIGLAVLAVILFVAFQVMKSRTKSSSPEVKQTYSVGAAKVDLFYCSPSKKGRDIFGGLIKYGEVWRTGANEPTTFETDKNLTIGGKSLPAGKYSLWTIPQKDSWTVILNKEIPYWGDGSGGKAARNDKTDVLQVVVPVKTPKLIQEKLTIDANNNELTISWDIVKVSVPITVE